MKHFKYIVLVFLFAGVLFATDGPYCLNFGDNSYVHIEDQTLRFTTRFTLECWFSIEEFTDSSALIDFSTNNLSAGTSFGYGIYSMDSNRIAIRLGNINRSLEVIIDSLKQDIWYHIAVTYDRFKNDENVVVFLNGHVVKKADCDIYLQYPETFRPYGVMLGVYYDYPYIGSLHGKLDDIRFWSDIRTNEEIFFYMDRPVDPDAQGLVGYYTFDQDIDTVITDQSGSQNHGTFYNMSDSSWQLSYAHLAVEQPSDVSFNRLVLPWTTSHEFTSYCVDLSTTPDFSTSLDGFPVYNVSTNYLIVDEIDPGTYYYRVKGHYEGESIESEPWSDVQAVSTVTDVSTAIELSDFRLECIHHGVKIHWTTASQTENASFVLERQTENKEWEKIYCVPGNGTSSDMHSYSYTDPDVLPGTAYSYRLKDISYSGVVSVSEEKKVYIPDDDPAGSDYKLKAIYPNPFNPETRISFELSENARVTLSIFSSDGKRISDLLNGEINSGAYELTWRPEQIPSGIYIVIFNVNTTITSHKLLYIK